MSFLGFVLWAAVVVLVLLPPEWDPAIRWRERQERDRQERKRNG